MEMRFFGSQTKYKESYSTSYGILEKKTSRITLQNTSLPPIIEQ